MDDLGAIVKSSKGKMNTLFKIAALTFLIALLVLIRLFEERLFYNVLLDFFKTSHSTSALPEFDSLKLAGNITIRYFLNTVISLGILWVLFKNKSILKLSAVLYLFLFAILFVVFLILIHTDSEGPYLTLFYVRRFLIQPIFLLVLIPAFYFQGRK